MTIHGKTSSGCFIPFKVKKTYLFMFGKTDGWWAKYFKGFTHVCLIEYVSDEYVIGYEPLLIGCSTIWRTAPDKDEIKYWKDWTILEVTVYPTRKNRLIGPVFQTCATIVQYIAGISLGCVLANSLYKKLTTSSAEWLKEKGIQGVKLWEWHQQP